MAKSNSQKDLRLSIYQKNLDNIKLLVSHKPFQDIVKETREYLDIPKKGIQDTPDFEVWYSKHSKKSNDILFSNEFINKTREIRKQQKDPNDIEFDLKQHYDQIPIDFFKNRIDFIIETFNLPDHYAKYIRTYILINEVTAPGQNFVTSAYVQPLPPGQRYINIQVYTKLSDDDLKQLGNWVNNIYGRQLPKYQKLKDVDTRIEMEKWYKNRIKKDTLEQSYYKMTAEEIAKNITGNSSDTNRVRDSIRKLEELRKSRFGK